ncbi:MAG TPA: hypothetical protein VGP03_00785 [Pseudonocardiaceae bacterium]|nr:hypothetical protein [Pseudonocardiaceae bacterium]
MTVVDRPSSQEELVATGPRRRTLPGVLVAAVVCVVVALLAQVPFLRNRFFYVWDDSAAQFLPTWHYLGQRLSAGHWPEYLDVQNWMGGNFAAEALFGLWNPVDLANYWLVSRFDDLALAALVVKTEFLVLLALGVYLLCREYRAGKGAAAAIAVALPFSGFTLFYDTSSWAAGLMAFSSVPHVWWSTRRMARGVGSPLWPFLFGALAVTTGNPYGLLGVCAVLLALLVENWGNRAALIKVLAVGVLIGLVVPLVYLPLLGNSPVTDRAGQGFASDGMLMPRLSDFLNSSMPSAQPMIGTFASPTRMTVPAMYFAWFVLPLLPWLRWGVLRKRWREFLGVFVVAAGYLALAIGPSNLWMFRFPLRHVEMVFLALGVLFAVLLTGGLSTGRLRARALVTAALIAGSTYLSFAAGPWEWRRHLVSAVLLAVGVALVVWFARSGRPRAVPAVLVLGVAATLGLQTVWFPANHDIAGYEFSPRTVSQAEKNLQYPGAVFQVGFLVVGNAGLPAGHDSITSYSGMGYRKFKQATCMTYRGATCAASYDMMLQPTELGGRALVDLMRVDVLLVQRTMVDDPVPPAGWAVAHRNEVATDLRREDPLPWKDGRLSFVDGNVQVSADKAVGDQEETVRFTKSGGAARLAFARLDWPGYRAEVDGKPIQVSEGPAGLVVVDLPDGVNGGELKLTWEPPGLKVGIGAAAAGALGALVLAALERARRRRRTSFSTDQPV